MSGNILVKCPASHKMSCMITKWYPQFRDVTFETLFIDIPHDLCTYLKSDDSLVLPEDSNTNDISDSDWGDSDTPQLTQPTFIEFSEQVKVAIADLGGSVLPKLNWSAPRDATWISFNKSLRCHSFNDIILLLKSSEFIMHDLTQPFSHCDASDNSFPLVEYKLALRRWENINESEEFRCFVYNRELLAVSQRNESTYYPELKPMMKQISNELKKFFRRKIRSKFTKISNYVFDVWRRSEDDIILVDFNVFSSSTDALLFTWGELSSMIPEADKVPNGDRYDFDEGEGREGGASQSDEREVVARCVTEADKGIRGCSLARYAMPVDFYELGTGQDINKLVDLLNAENYSSAENS